MSLRDNTERHLFYKDIYKHRGYAYFLYSLQDVRISLERINEIHHATNENEGHEYKTSFCNESLGISLNNISFKYDSHALRIRR